MTDYDFDVIVVGAGIAGSVCATLLARSGAEVLLIERGAEPGSKNLSGGVFYPHVMTHIFPDFVESAPVERVITRNVVAALTPHSSVSMDYWDQRLANPVNAVSVLRSKLDPWLAQQAEEAGVSLISGVKVEGLLRDGPYVSGVVATGEEMRAKVTVCADGVNSFLASDAGLRPAVSAHHLGLGVKSVIQMEEKTIQERFALRDGEGVAYSFIGDATCGIPGGGFLYTNRDTISIGVVLLLDALARSGKSSSDIHDHFLSHPAIEPLIRSGEVIEYGCHLVAEGGQQMQQEIVHDGLLMVGDAAGFTLNTGLTLRGMDLAAGSAQAAAQAITQALAAEDFSRLQLRSYLDHLKNSFVGADMHTYRKAPKFFESHPVIFDGTSDLLTDILYRTYRHDGQPKDRLLRHARTALKASSVKMSDLIRAGIGAIRSL
ncbi:FAD-dependent oxidoreductase [Trueperella sp. LYQ143]|uniref:FAD-dependent oxidoreductase n=1 Tax=unclassified Trueperella TaxID=2630174 RepID=UPI003983C80A